MSQTPSVGRIVHYVSYGTPGGEYPSVCRAAIVTDVDQYQPPANGRWYGHVSLAVLNPDGMFFNRSVLQDEEQHRGGTWHWPERVEQGPVTGQGVVDVDPAPLAAYNQARRDGQS